MGVRSKQQDFQRLIDIGIALSKEREMPLLLERILRFAKDLTRADGGTLYTVTPEGSLHFEMILSDSLNIHLGGSSEQPITFPDLPMKLPDGRANDSLMVAYAANHKETININDAYTEEGFDFSGTRAFDQKTGYRTQAVLTVPMMNHEGEVLAVLQLINPLNEETGRVELFSPEDIQLAESLSSLAGITLTNQLLIANLEELFKSLIRVIAAAIDEKSPSTGNHGKRVPIVATLLAEAVNASSSGPYEKESYSPEEIYELEVAAFLHDCGKITTPVHVVEKQMKLETIFDRIELIKERYRRLRAEAELAGAEDTALASLDEECTFLEECNISREELGEAALERLKKIPAERLTDDERYNLSIKKGNLTDEERKIIENHVVVTYEMLSQLAYPQALREVPEIAASHHERIDGKGYFRGLTGDQMSSRAKILAIADIFEALSAPDRPYKKAMPLSQVLKIMSEMVEEGHLDRDLFEIFINKKAYLKYARDYLSPEQIDVD